MPDNLSKISNLQKLISALHRTGDIHQALLETQLSPARAYQILRGRRARILLRQYRKLAALHLNLTLTQSSSRAVSTLLQHLSDSDDPKLQVQSALSLFKLNAAEVPIVDLHEFDY